MTKRNIALIGATIVSIIYGLTFTLAKDVMPIYVQAYGFIIMRVGGATILFWLFWLYNRRRKEIREEKIDPKDYLRIVIAAFFGVALNMLSFFKGLNLTSPISASVLMVSTPMIVLVLSAIIIKERIKKRMVFGIVLGLIGTAFLIIYGKSVENAPNASLGNFLVFVNASSYGLYLVLVKKLMDKYNPYNFAKWVYLIGFIMVLPFGWSEFEAVNWGVMPLDIYLKIGFVVVFSTFLTYLLNLLSMKELKPTTIAVFVYLQPVFASIFAISLGKDELTLVKIIAAVLIFTGVYLVTQKPLTPGEEI
jgi:drug/metabolite transporter (DMT)-like permease